MLRSRHKVILYHILFWITYSSIFTFVEGGYSNKFQNAFYIEVVYLPFRLVVVYLNFFWLMPKYLLNRKIGLYMALTIFTIIIASFGHRYAAYYHTNAFIFPGWEQGDFWQAYKFLQSGMIITSPMIFLIGLTIVSKWVSTERRAELLEKEKLKAELGYLRSQINPHFFFNTLNNLYGLALQKSDRTAEVVMKLSELMSYILYKADREHVPLSKEIDQIERYIALEQIRYENRFNLDFQVDGDIDQYQIPPLLLLPFVENSFKHGVNKDSQKGWVGITIQVSETKFYFSIKNKIPVLKEKDGTNNNGLGIANTKKRLELLFPNCHSLVCVETKELFNVILTITRADNES